MMRTTILVTALLVSMLSASAVYAQRVESALYDGLHPVINCDGMQSSLYTTAAKGSTEAELKTAAANGKVYKRFSVYNKDNSTSSNWSTSFTVCSNVSGGGWRLPTQRELMLMWVLKRELEKTSGFTPFAADYYGSATEGSSSSNSNNSNSWVVDFTNGNTSTDGTKDSSRWVRCVREI